MSPSRVLNGIELYYEDGGEGPAIVLSHGYSATSAMWAPQRPVLEQAFRLLTWDMRGHGATASPDSLESYSMALVAQDLRSLLDSLALEHVVVGGLSLGGFLSLDFYRRYPDRVRALVICDSGPGYRDPEARAKWNESAEQRARELEERGLSALSAASREMGEAAPRHRSARGLALAARGMLAQFDDAVINSLPDIEVPTLILVGSEDRPFLAASEYMASKIPGARLEVVEGAGHAANLDQPERFNEILLDFLKSSVEGEGS